MNNFKYLNNKEDVINNDLLKYRKLYNYKSIKRKFVLLEKVSFKLYYKMINIKNECHLCKKNILI